MHQLVDPYARLDSPVHRWPPRAKFISLFALMMAFALVSDVRLAPVMLLIAGGLFALARLPLGFLFGRLRYPGVFLLTLVLILPLMTGETVIARAGFVVVYAEGLTHMLLVVSRFIAILVVGLVLFGTTPFLTSVRTLRALGLPALLTDMLILTVRYLFDLADMLTRMQRAMRLRGFRATRLNRHHIGSLAGLVVTLLVRSFEQAERVYQAMRLRGYGAAGETGHMDASNQHKPALQLSGVQFAYPGRPATLRALDLTIPHSQRVAVIGCNGAGKTTLFLTICGVLKADAGQIQVGGQRLTPGHFHPALGLVFQNADDQLFSSTVYDDVAFGPVNLGLDDATVARRVEAALTLTDTSHLAERAPYHLSGGEKRMVAIASVLALEPDLVLYDEPDANLDLRARRRLIAFLRAAPHTVMIATHDLELVLEVCDRVLLLADGQIVADGVPRDVLGDDKLMTTHGLEKPHSLLPHPYPA